MDKIASFRINHDILKKGMYLSRVDRDIITYDLRMVVPNVGPYLENASIHTFEHLFATYVRNTSFTDAIVYFGPMGCRTGFYFITRDTMTGQQALDLVRETLAFIAAYEGPIPGAETSRECGNYREHDLSGAQKIAVDISNILTSWTPADFAYAE